MKRILIYCRRGYGLFQPQSTIPFGGAEVDLYHLARAFTKRHDVYFACEKDPSFPPSETIDGIHVLRIAPLLRPLFLKPVAFVRLFHETLQLLRRIQPHVILQETACFETGLLCLLKGRSRFLYRVAHDMDVNGQFRAVKPWVARFYELGLKRADAVVVQTSYQAKCAAKNYGIHSVLIPNAQPMLASTPRPPIESRKSLLWIGRLVPLKRPEFFIQLAQQHKHMPFIFIGNYDNDTSYTLQIKSTLATMPNMETRWFVPWRELPLYYQRAAYLVITSPASGEGYPNVIVEAMKYGCPIYSLEWNRDHVITANDVGLVFDGDVHSFITSLPGAIHDVGLRKRLSENAYAYAEKHHNVEEIIAQYEEILERLHS
ncbi:glycosyltransferase family 4 protein [Desulfosoma sp.]